MYLNASSLLTWFFSASSISERVRIAGSKEKPLISSVIGLLCLKSSKANPFTKTSSFLLTKPPSKPRR